jgi:hypothetical protein
MSNRSNRLSQGVKPMLPEEIEGKGSTIARLIKA